MPHRIDTTKIQRINLYTKVIESANAVPGTSREVLDNAISTMRFDIEDMNRKALNIILLINSFSFFMLFFIVFYGIAILIHIPIFIAVLTLFINRIREEVNSVDEPAKALTEGTDNVPPLSPTTRIIWK